MVSSPAAAGPRPSRTPRRPAKVGPARPRPDLALPDALLEELVVGGPSPLCPGATHTS